MRYKIFPLLATLLIPLSLLAQGRRGFPTRGPDSSRTFFAPAPKSRAHLGLEISILPNSNDSYGVTVESVVPRGPADLAGLQAGDIITKVNTISIGSDTAGEQAGVGQRFSAAIATLEPDKEAIFLIRRGDLTLSLKLVPDRDRSVIRMSVSGIPGRETGFPDFDMPSRRGGRFGPPPGSSLRSSFSSLSRLSLAPVNQDLSGSLGVPVGVLVIAITPPGVVVINGLPVSDRQRRDMGIRDSTPDPLELRTGDVITAVDGRAISTPEQFLRVIGSYRRGDDIHLTVTRQKREILIKTAKD